MRGRNDRQPELLGLISPESLIPQEHPLRAIKKHVDSVLREMSPLFDEIYSQEGRPSIPPERLLKSKLLIALYSVRSERLFVEQVQYNFLFRWFLDMNLMEPAWHATVFSQNQERLLKHAVAHLFFEQVVALARDKKLLSDEHFSVDGTLIESWASLKSFQPKGAKGGSDDEDPGNPTVDFRGEKRSNATHQSKSDPEARLYRKGKGKEAKLYFTAHALMENRHGFCLGLRVTSATETTEVAEAEELLNFQGEVFGLVPKSVGADKGYHSAQFVGWCRERGISPHVAEVKGRNVAGLDGRTTKTAGYQMSERCRKRIEEIFGWMKTIGGLRRTRYRGIARTGMAAHWVATAYNLLRLSKLCEPCASPA